MIKAIFFDIDGTLVSFDTHTVPQSTIETLEVLKKKGIKVFIATGRHLKSINNLGELTFDGYITINGGYCMAGAHEVIYKNPIASQDIEALKTWQEKNVHDRFPCMLVQENELYLSDKNERVEEVLTLLNFPEPPILPLRNMPEGDVFQIVAFFDESREKKIMPDLKNCESTRWSPLFTDIVPKGGSKRIGIDKMIAHFGFALDETMAFGDGGNDIQMLRHVGLGVAMGNAEEEVKRAAHYITASVDDDGIYKALKNLNIL
ncbi:MAG: Cof-type HAD-IIB family hydrolase [Tannerellaceae bacterium]|nr:Cof-type HAD-IIB family hydrolase [Tannerellaceae bacterium]